MKQLLLQAARFSTVGGGATALHIGAAIALNGLTGLSALRSNFAAFLIAVSISYLGNCFWTFGAASRHQRAVPRFLLLSLICFSVNQAIVFGVVTILAQPLWLAMIPVAAIVPAFGFWLNRTWVFVPAEADA